MRKVQIQEEDGVQVQIGSTIITVWDAASPTTEKQVAGLIKKWLSEWLLKERL